ncbi:hypothetical protein [Erythrobacter sp. YT30]|uniref:hypothetical protein n=1 Tax=Erythrobacter sp. YT30 TaxID=1735012 RepID=UPI00076C64BF|nr:hypothetical protein [Erythrobacter sp. YT30]KWV91584.1 hypothetical protein AUC45_10180 [Erythrobacter sp. YT30]
MSNPFDEFANDWLSVLRRDARIAFEHAPLGKADGTHCDIANRFVQSLGLKSIGFNWELLDPDGEIDMARSALGQLTQALSHDISNPSKTWLAHQAAEHCARQFLALFDPNALTVVANRYHGLWNPISGAASEWGFVAYDNAHIALLLIADT